MSHSPSRSLFFFSLFIILNNVHGQVSPPASPAPEFEPPAIDPGTIDPKTGLWEIAFHGGKLHHLAFVWL